MILHRTHSCFTQKRKNNKKKLRRELSNLERKGEIAVKILGWNREEIVEFSMQETLHSLLTFTGTKPRWDTPIQCCSTLQRSAKAYQDHGEPSSLNRFPVLNIFNIFPTSCASRNETCDTSKYTCSEESFIKSSRIKHLHWFLSYRCQMSITNVVQRKQR